MSPNFRKHMPRGVLPTLITAVGLAFASAWAAETENRFLSWYNGWGSHRVWGAGQVTGSYEDAFVECGGKQIKVVPIYDTHASRLPPMPEQSSTFARSHNVASAKALATKGIKCAFQPEGEYK
jgi:hypothetical protein